MCVFCEKEQQKLQRHQRRKHKEESEVAAALALEEGSEIQILAFERLRLKDDYHHNCNVLALGEGKIIVVRNPTTQQDPKSFLPCPHCLGFFKGDELWRHSKKCPHKSQDGPQKFAKVQQDAKLLPPTSPLSTNEVDQALYRAVLTSMKNDEILHVAWNDDLTVKFRAANFEKKCELCFAKNAPTGPTFADATNQN